MRNSLTYTEKEEALQLMMEGKATPTMLANRYGCGNGLPQSKFGMINKRNRDPTYNEVIALTMKDCDDHRALGKPLSGLMISEFAANNAGMICNDTSGVYSEQVKNKYKNATFGKSFVNSFKARYEFRRQRVNGERASVNEEETEEKPLVIMEKTINSLAGPAL